MDNFINPHKWSETEKQVLASLQALLSMIGSANDADDHGYGEDAERMRDEACDAIRDMLREHSFLSEVVPSLAKDIGTPAFMAVGWLWCYREVSAKIEGMGGEEA